MKKNLFLALFAFSVLVGCEKDDDGSLAVENELTFNLNEIVDSRELDLSTISISEVKTDYSYNIWYSPEGSADAVWLYCKLEFTYNSHDSGPMRGTLGFYLFEEDDMMSKITFVDEKIWRFKDINQYTDFFNNSMWMVLGEAGSGLLSDNIATEIKEVDGKNYMFLEKKFSGRGWKIYQDGINGIKISNGAFKGFVPLD